MPALIIENASFDLCLQRLHDKCIEARSELEAAAKAGLSRSDLQQLAQRLESDLESAHSEALSAKQRLINTTVDSTLHNEATSSLNKAYGEMRSVLTWIAKISEHCRTVQSAADKAFALYDDIAPQAMRYLLIANGAALATVLGAMSQAWQHTEIRILLWYVLLPLTTGLGAAAFGNVLMFMDMAHRQVRSALEANPFGKKIPLFIRWFSGGVSVALRVCLSVSLLCFFSSVLGGPFWIMKAVFK